MLIILADHTNTNTGKAWPAFGRLAKLGGVTTRTAKRAVARLTALDLIAIAEHGGPGRSNRYRLNWDIFEQSEDSVDDDTMQPAMVTAKAANGDIRDPRMVTTMSPNPINPSEQEAKDEIEGSQADCEAAPPRLGASDLPHKKGYERFWDAWGRKVTVSETERLIDAKVEEGHTLDDIVAGAQRFQKYCADTTKPSRIKPAAFVHGEKWRDDWKLHRIEPKTKESKAKASDNNHLKSQENPWIINNLYDIHNKDYNLQEEIYYKELGLDPEDYCITPIVVQEMMEIWGLANPEPLYWKNTVTGETWGEEGDACPRPDWSPSRQDIP